MPIAINDMKRNLLRANLSTEYMYFLSVFVFVFNVAWHGVRFVLNEQIQPLYQHWQSIYMVDAVCFAEEVENIIVFVNILCKHRTVLLSPYFNIPQYLICLTRNTLCLYLAYTYINMCVFFFFLYLETVWIIYKMNQICIMNYNILCIRHISAST